MLQQTILGIDPGSRKTGFGLILKQSNHLSYVDSGVIDTTAANNLFERLKIIFQGVDQIICHHQPKVMIIENVFVSKNANSAMKLGQARGAAISAGVHNNLPIFEYSAKEIKQSVSGRGNAAKEQVQHMVTALLNLPGVPSSDAADALACAICYVQKQTPLMQKLQSASI